MMRTWRSAATLECSAILFDLFVSSLLGLVSPLPSLPPLPLPSLSPPHLLVPTFLSLGSGPWIRKALSSIPASATTEWVTKRSSHQSLQRNLKPEIPQVFRTSAAPVQE